MWNFDFLVSFRGADTAMSRRRVMDESKIVILFIVSLVCFGDFYIRNYTAHWTSHNLHWSSLCSHLQLGELTKTDITLNIINTNSHFCTTCLHISTFVPNVRMGKWLGHFCASVLQCGFQLKHESGHADNVPRCRKTHFPYYGERILLRAAYHFGRCVDAQRWPRKVDYDFA